MSLEIVVSPANEVDGTRLMEWHVPCIRIIYFLSKTPSCNESYPMSTSIRHEENLRDKVFCYVRDNSIPFSSRESDLYLKSTEGLSKFLRDLGIMPSFTESFRNEISGEMAIELPFYADKARYQTISDVEMSHLNGGGTLRVTSCAAYGPNFSIANMGDYGRIKIAPKYGAIDISPDYVGLLSITLEKEALTGNEVTWNAELEWHDGSNVTRGGVQFEGNKLSEETLKAAIEKCDLWPLPEDFNPDPEDEVEP
ncbi:hypothetical protein [Acetobacter pomorum]|nr:hypothetical protein [Acetobacter pomorum]